MKSKTKKLFLLLSSLVIYLIIGAFVFEAVEHGNNTGETRMKEIFCKIKSKTNFTREEFNEFLSDIQDVFQATNYGSKWTLYTSVYFCGSVVTTIGTSTAVN